MLDIRMQLRAAAETRVILIGTDFQVKLKRKTWSVHEQEETWKEMQGPGRSLLMRRVQCTLLQLNEVFYQSVDQFVLPFSLYKA